MKFPNCRMFDEVSLLRRILFCLGIPGFNWRGEGEKECKLLTRKQMFFSVWMFGMLSLQCMVFITDARECTRQGRSCTKSNLSLVVIRFIHFAVWIACYLNRKVFAKMWHDLATLRRRRNVIRYQRIYDIVTALIVAVLFAVIVINITIFLSCQEIVDEYMTQLKLIQFVSHESLRAVLASVYVVSFILFLVLLPNLLSLLFVCWCWIVAGSLKDCESSLISSPAKFMRRYDEIHLLYRKFQEAYSLPILLQTCNSFIFMLIPLANIFGYFSYKGNVVFQSYNIASMAINVATFLVVLPSGAAVSHADQQLRQRVREFCFRLSLSSESERVLKNFMKSKEDIALSACKMFTFTRSLPLSFFGALLTYNLLILQSHV